MGSLEDNKNASILIILLVRSRRSMDRTHPCGGCDVGSIPAGSTSTKMPEVFPAFFVLYVLSTAGIEPRAAALEERA